MEVLILTKSRVPAAQLERFNEISKAYRGFTRSPNGKVVLKDLRKKFYDADLCGDSEHSAAVKAGRHSVILYILRMMETEL